MIRRNVCHWNLWALSLSLKKCSRFPLTFHFANWRPLPAPAGFPLLFSLPALPWLVCKPPTASLANDDGLPGLLRTSLVPASAPTIIRPQQPGLSCCWTPHPWILTCTQINKHNTIKKLQGRVHKTRVTAIIGSEGLRQVLRLTQKVGKGNWLGYPCC